MGIQHPAASRISRMRRPRGRFALPLGIAGLALLSAVGCGVPGSTGTPDDDTPESTLQSRESPAVDSDYLVASPRTRTAQAQGRGSGTQGDPQEDSAADGDHSNASTGMIGATRPTASGMTRNTLVHALSQLAAQRKDEVSVVVYDRATGRSFSYNDDDVYCTASIMKVALMAVLLYKDEQSGKTVSAAQRQLLTRMIENSDNAAATDIWNELGRGPGISPILRRWGMTHTVLRSDSYWGLTQTTAGDQVRLLQVVSSPNSWLKAADQQLALNLMEHVEADQRWGVSGGIPSGVTVALKNGWSPATSDNWRINSIGMVRGDERDYVIAVLTFHNPTEAYGIETITKVSSLVWQALAPTGGSARG